MKQSVYEYETSCGEECTLEHYLTHTALFVNSDISDISDKVKLMTVHTAKGLEFPYVFLCGMNEGIFPSKKTKTLPGMEEERRLAFVALTRAEKGLYISESEGRNLDGSIRYPSRFIIDIDQTLLNYKSEPPKELIEDAKMYIGIREQCMKSDSEDKELFEKGQRVNHLAFGDGTITDVDTEKSAYIIQFDKITTPRVISFRVKLKIID